MRTLRTYRLVPALLALSLVLTAATPLLRHSCGMTMMEMAEKPCCKGKAGHHGMPAMASYEGAEAYGAPADAVPPCHDAPATEAPEAPCSETPDWLTLQASCCSYAEAAAAPALERVQPVPASVLALVAAFALPALKPPPSPPRLLGASPPAPPAALHVLYGSFLI